MVAGIGYRGLETLAKPSYRNRQVLQQLQHAAQASDGCGNDHQILAPHRGVQRVSGSTGQLEGGRQRYTGQVARIDALRLESRQLYRVAHPQRELVLRRAGRTDGQRRTPGTRTDDRNFHGGQKTAKPIKRRFEGLPALQMLQRLAVAQTWPGS